MKLRIKPVIGYLIEIDKLLIKHWKIIFFIAFLIPFTILLLEAYSLGNLISVDVDRFGDKSIGLGRTSRHLLEVFSPLIVLIVWKRIFHPND